MKNVWKFDLQRFAEVEPDSEGNAGEEKTFTQADLDKVLSERLAREREKYEKQVVPEKVEKWKEENLPSILESEIEKRFPAETEEQKQLRQLREEIQTEKQARVRENLLNQATKYAVEKSLPVDLVDFFVTNEEETTTKNLGKFEELWNKHTETVKESAVNGVLKDHGREVKQSKGEEGGSDMNSIIRRLAGRE